MLGPSVLKYIERLRLTVLDDIECKHLTERGICKHKKRLCDHVENNKACSLYEGNRPVLKGDPLGRIR